MNKYIKKQLNKCRIPIPDFDDNTTHLVIHRNEELKRLEELQIGSYYEIEIADYIVNEPPTFTLSANWNAGTKPPEHSMNVQVIQMLGKMIKVRGAGINTNINWEGFLPKKSIRVVRKYE